MNNDDISLFRCFDLNLLPVFLTVVQEHSISRAAILLNMSQPAVSNAMLRLKRAYGNELFIRCGRGIEPTEFAMTLFYMLTDSICDIRKTIPKR